MSSLKDDPWIIISDLLPCAACSARPATLWLIFFHINPIKSTYWKKGGMNLCKLEDITPRASSWYWSPFWLWRCPRSSSPSLPLWSSWRASGCFMWGTIWENRQTNSEIWTAAFSRMIFSGSGYLGDRYSGGLIETIGNWWKSPWNKGFEGCDNELVKSVRCGLVAGVNLV